MQSIAEQMMSRYQVVKQTGGVNSEWNDAVDRAMKAIDNRDMRTKQPWTFKRWCGYLRGVPAQEIHRLVAIAEKSSNPGRKFNWLLKQRGVDKCA